MPLENTPPSDPVQDRQPLPEASESLRAPAGQVVPPAQASAPKAEGQARWPFFPPIEKGLPSSESAAPLFEGRLAPFASGRTGMDSPRIGGDKLVKDYAELLSVAERKLARIPSGLHDFTAHSLVHDAYVRLMEGAGSPLDSRSEIRFAMNRAIHDELVESARRAASFKHGGYGRRVPFEAIEEDLVTTPRDEALLEVHEAVMKLKQNDPVHARIVTLRFFGGLTMEEIAEVLDCSVTTVERKWRGLKEWLARELRF